jgi:hypothetical protein
LARAGTCRTPISSACSWGATTTGRTYAANGTALQPSVYSPLTDPVVDAPPRLLTPPTLDLRGDSKAPVGNEVLCDNGTWDQMGPRDPFTYQWLNNAYPLPGETGEWIRVPNYQGDLSCTVTARNPLGTVVAHSDSAPIDTPW